MMNKMKFLIAVIIALVISNIIILFLLIKEHSQEGGPKNIIIDKLHFDKEQVNNYETYIQQHRRSINDNEALMNKLRSDLYKQLKNQQDSTIIDSMIFKIAMQQSVAEHINYNHFLEIKKMCKPNQKKDFDELTNEIAQLFSLKERK